MRGVARIGGMVLSLALAAATPARAIETDQYYAWGRPIADSTEILNAKMNLEIDRALARVNARASWKRLNCSMARKRVVDHFRLLIFHELELWANNTSLVARIPSTSWEELKFRDRYLYHDHGKFDFVTAMPPSPTIELAGVRMGTDKLTHFMSEGWWYYKWYYTARADGLSREEALGKVLDHGILTERTVLGMAASGVLSVADLEANIQGMLWLESLCDLEQAQLEQTEDGWQFTGEFDFRDWVTPVWDESYQPSIYGKRRWKRVRPVLLQYCPMLDDPWVLRQRETYAAHDRDTPTEARIRELVEEGTLPDPRTFTLEHACAEGVPAP